MPEERPVKERRREMVEGKGGEGGKGKGFEAEGQNCGHKGHRKGECRAMKHKNGKDWGNLDQEPGAEQEHNQ